MHVEARPNEHHQPPTQPPLRMHVESHLLADGDHGIAEAIQLGLIFRPEKV